MFLTRQRIPIRLFWSHWTGRVARTTPSLSCTSYQRVRRDFLAFEMCSGGWPQTVGRSKKQRTSLVLGRPGMATPLKTRLQRGYSQFIGVSTQLYGSCLVATGTPSSSVFIAHRLDCCQWIDLATRKNESASYPVLHYADSLNGGEFQHSPAGGEIAGSMARKPPHRSGEA